MSVRRSRSQCCIVHGSVQEQARQARCIGCLAKRILRAIRLLGLAWDTSDGISAFKNKKQLLWERERGFIIRDRREGYPTPKEAWQQFQSLVNDHTERRGWVKRIAVAHWMTVGDIKWYVRPEIFHRSKVRCGHDAEPQRPFLLASY